MYATVFGNHTLQILEAPAQRSVKSEPIDFGDAAELLGEDGIAAIKNTMKSFRR